MEDKTRCTWFEVCVTPRTIYAAIDGSAMRAAIICARAELDAVAKETRYYDAGDGALLYVEEWGEWETDWVSEAGWEARIDALEAVAVYLRKLRDARAERDPERLEPAKVIRTDYK